MKKADHNPLGVIAAASEVPAYNASAVKTLMAELGLNEKAFALLMNVTPSTVRTWTTGAARPCGLSRRLMQIYETCPEVVDALADARGSCR